DLQQFRHAAGLYIAVSIIVDHQRWGLVAVAQAADRNQGEASISSSLSRLDADLLLDAVEHIFVTADVAGHAVAHANDVTADGDSEDLAVEGRHAFDIAGGNAENF